MFEATNLISRSFSKYKCLKTILILVIIFSATISFIRPTFALKTYGDNCLSCHQSGGISISSNVSSIQVDPNESFWVEIDSEGGEPGNMIVIWSDVSHNSFFSFSPSEVDDNDINDVQNDGGQITGSFKVVAPNQEGNYIIRTFSTSSSGRGGFVDIAVLVGTGGSVIVPITLQEMVWGLFTTAVPTILIFLSVFGAVLHLVNWRKYL
jgi:hypothetical protein